MLYQIRDRYDDEEKLILRIMAEHTDWEYINKRAAWHQRPEFHPDPNQAKFVPRKPLHLPRNPFHIPKQETLEKLCIVTGGDSEYFEFIVEAIESIKATRFYKDVDIAIIDSGLTEEQLNYLEAQWHPKIVSLDWYVPISYLYFSPESFLKGEDSRKYSPIMNRMFLDRIIPGYDYYIWMDPDAWVQDECCIDKFLFLCERQGHAFFRSNAETKTLPDYGIGVFPIYYWNKIQNLEHIAGTFNCFNKDFALQRSLITEKVLQFQKNWWWNSDEKISLYTIADWPQKELLRDQELYAIYMYGMPYVKSPEDNVLYDINTLKEIGIYSTYINKKQYYWDVQNLDHFDDDRIEKNREFTRLVFENTENDYPNKVKKSLRFRVLPWSNKTELKNTLLKELNATN